MTDEWSPIEGETPLDDMSGLKDRSIKTRGQLAIAEAENIRKAVMRYLTATPSKKLSPFTFEWMLETHREMFGDVWDWAGQPRTTHKTIGMEAHLIGQELGGLCLDIAAWSDGVSRLEQSVTIHYRAVRIHPFENGNGRWARLLANIWLKRHREPVIVWPEPELGQETSSVRTLYLDAIRAADKHDLTLLTELHRQYQGE